MAMKSKLFKMSGEDSPVELVLGIDVNTKAIGQQPGKPWICGAAHSNGQLLRQIMQVYGVQPPPKKRQPNNMGCYWGREALQFSENPPGNPREVLTDDFCERLQEEDKPNS
ncbi:hypothetical protein EV363DRAFT_1302513 [Boletus edulis]|nr:hypothetical protein EV363DRAFT_1302513 [Boletus edulis]